MALEQGITIAAAVRSDGDVVVMNTDSERYPMSTFQSVDIK
jgi:hypothetical protein